MSKPKTTKTSPQGATKTRARSRTSDSEATDAQNASGAPTGAADATPAEPKTSGKATKKTRAPKEDLVVFAFRLTEAERSLIHQAAGPAKASRFVRALTVAAARGDLDAVTRMVEAVKADQ